MGLNLGRKHKWAQQNLSAWIDGRLSADEAKRLQVHLEACPSCRADAASLKATRALLAELPLLAVPRSFAVPASVAPVQRRYHRQARILSVMRTATVTASALFLMAFAGSAYLSGGYGLLQSALEDELADTEMALPETVEPAALVLGGAAEVPPTELAAPERDGALASTEAVAATAPDVELLDGEPASEALAQVAGPADVKPGVPGYGGGVSVGVSALPTPEGIEADATVVKEPIIMLREAQPSASDSGSEVGMLAVPAPDGPSAQAAITPESARVPEAVDPGQVVEPEVAAGLDDPAARNDRAVQGIVLLRMLSGIFAGLALVSSAGMLWFGAMRRTA